MLGYLLKEGLFSFTNVQFLALHLALYNIDKTALFLSWCPVLRVYKFLSECVGRFELHCTVAFEEDSPDFFFETPDS